MKAKPIIILLLLVSSGVGSYFYHQEVKFHFIRFYYTKIKKLDAASSLQKAKKLYERGKYDEVIALTDNLRIIYPLNTKLKRISGIVHIKYGDKLRGAMLLLPIISKKTGDRELLKEVMRILFIEEYYNDIVSSLTSLSAGNDPALNYYMGVSLVKTGKEGKALPYFIKSEERGNTRPDVYFYMGLVHEKRGSTKKATARYRESLRINPFHRKSLKSLIGIYRKQHRFKDAARLLKRSRL